MTLGVYTGPIDPTVEQLNKKRRVVGAIQERTAVCQDVQTEQVMCRLSLGVGRVNHILRVHGATASTTTAEAELSDGVTDEALQRLFPGVTEEGREQATFSRDKGGIGWRRPATWRSPRT